MRNIVLDDIPDKEVGKINTHHRIDQIEPVGMRLLEGTCEQEYNLVRSGQLLFTYFHFACEKELTEAMLKSGAVCLAYETVQLPNGSLPLLQPMSEVAGRMAHH